MEATVKGVDIRSKILPSIAECCPVESVLPSETALSLALSSTSLPVSPSASPDFSASSSRLSSSLPFSTSHSITLSPSLSLSRSSSIRPAFVPAETLRQAVEMQERHRSLVINIYSSSSPEMAASTIRLADLYSLSGRYLTIPVPTTQPFLTCPIQVIQRKRHS